MQRTMLKASKSVTALFLSVILVLLVGYVFTDSVSAQSLIKLKAGESAVIDADDTLKNWTSSDKSVAIVKSGRITALTKGTAIITAELGNGGTTERKVTVTTNPKIVGAKKKAEKLVTFPIKVKGAATKIKYSSSKPEIASITAGGDITTKKVGTTTIKAKVNGTILSFKLKVYIKPIVNHYKVTFNKGYTYTLYYSEVGKAPKIVSENTKIVKVTKSGKLIAKKRGSTLVTFSRKYAKAIVKIKVV